MNLLSKLKIDFKIDVKNIAMLSIGLLAVCVFMIPITIYGKFISEVYESFWVSPIVLTSNNFNVSLFIPFALSFACVLILKLKDTESIVPKYYITYIRRFYPVLFFALVLLTVYYRHNLFLVLFCVAAGVSIFSLLYLIDISYFKSTVFVNLLNYLRLTNIVVCICTFVTFYYAILNYQYPSEFGYVEPSLGSESKYLLYNCLVNNNYDCDYTDSEYNTIATFLLKQFDPSGVLYHHSLVLFPISFMEKYGFAQPIQHLYGYGFDLAVYILIEFIGTFSDSYALLIPFAYGISFVFIFMIVYLATSSIPIAFFAILGQFLFINRLDLYTLVQAPGFIPLRNLLFYGQVAAILSSCKGHGVRPTLLLCALTTLISCIFNFEAAVIGAIIQCTFLLMQKEKDSKIGVIVLILIISSGAIFNSYINGTMLKTMHLAFLGLFGSPSLLILVIYTILIAALFSALFTVKWTSQTARACAIALSVGIALMATRFFYYPVGAHFINYIVSVFPLGMILFWIYVRYSNSILIQVKNYIELCFLIILILMLPRYAYAKFVQLQDSNTDCCIYTQINVTKNLNLNLSIMADRISEEILYLKSISDTNRRVMLISPSSQLFNTFYTPKNICGHFELTLNLVNARYFDKIIECTKEPMTLIVDRNIYSNPPKLMCDSNPNKCAAAKLISNSNSLLVKQMLPLLEYKISAGRFDIYEN